MMRQSDKSEFDEVIFWMQNGFSLILAQHLLMKQKPIIIEQEK